MEELDKALAKITEALNQLATTHGADAVDLTLEVARLHAISDVIGAVVFALVFGYLTKILYNQCDTKGDYGSSWNEFFAPMATGITGLVATVAAICIVNVPAWVGMFEPKVYLAYKLLGKII